MKRFSALLILLLLGTGCGSAKSFENQPQSRDDEKKPIAKVEAWPDVITEGAPAEFAIYRSKELGIEFLYPLTMGRPWENWYKGMYPLAVKFRGENETYESIALWAENDIAGIEEKEPKLRTCEDYMKNGRIGDDFPMTCDTRMIDGEEVRMLSLTRDRRAAIFMTKLGVWSINLADGTEKEKTEFEGIVASLKFK